MKSPKSADCITGTSVGQLDEVVENAEQTDFWRTTIELDTQFAGRYLFRNEIMFDELKAMKIATDKGFKPWVQVGLNAYLADTPNGRFGFGLSYNRGSLPPVFADTNSFLFGFVFQTVDDTKKP